MQETRGIGIKKHLFSIQEGSNYTMGKGLVEHATTQMNIT